jgi:hypothetical protein
MGIVIAVLVSLVAGFILGVLYAKEAKAKVSEVEVSATKVVAEVAAEPKVLAEDLAKKL